MQIKPQTVEAVLFFKDGGVCKEMLYPEFEAVLDGMVNIPEFADQQMHVAYVLINNRLQIRAAVFFYLDFNDDGSADSGWNIPLRSLAERTGRGPDLGAGPIRLACRSQCPVSWHQMHLWDPELTQERNHLILLRDRIKRNQLGLLVEEDSPQAVPAERLQMAAEDSWYAASVTKQADTRRAADLEREQRFKAAQLIKQQRQRIASLERQRELDINRLRELAAQQQATLQEEIDQLRQEMLQQERLAEQLRSQLHDQAAGFQKAREEMSKQLRAMEQNSRAEVEIACEQFEQELQEQVAEAVMEYKEQVSIRDVELAYRNELDNHLQEEIEQLRKQRDALTEQSGEALLERLSALGVAFMAYHPGAGHLTIPLSDMARYQQNQLSYAAAKCGVSEAQYRQWVEHYRQPTCVATLTSGERCDIPLDKIQTPGRFIIGESNCCTRHRSQNVLHTTAS